MQNTVAKKRAAKEDVDSDYPFGNIFNQELRIVRFSSFSQ
jgi:hypothetical protein